MPNWLEEILMGPTYLLGNTIWNVVMELIAGVITMTPQEFSSDTWSYVTDTLYPWALGCGVAVINMFFLIGFLRGASNLRENITIEMWVELFIKAMLANGLMLSGMSMIQQFFNLTSVLSGQVLINQIPEFSTENLDLGAWLFFFIFGSLYVIVAIICAMIILFTVYGRYLKLYWLAAVAPIAFSTLAGGRGLEHSAFSWFRTFLSNVFEILAIAMTLSIGGMMIRSIDFGVFDSAFLGIVDGFGSVLQSLITMILMTGAVKGAGSLLNRAFGL